MKQLEPCIPSVCFVKIQRKHQTNESLSGVNSAADLDLRCTFWRQMFVFLLKLHFKQSSTLVYCKCETPSRYLEHGGDVGTKLQSDSDPPGASESSAEVTDRSHFGPAVTYLSSVFESLKQQTDSGCNEETASLAVIVNEATFS